MTVRTSNVSWVTVKPPIPLDNTGWELVAVSPDDWATIVARVNAFDSMTFSDSSAEQGSGSLTLDATDPILIKALPAGIPGTILDREYLWKVYEDGLFRGEWLYQDIEKDVVPDDETKAQVKLAGQGTLSVLQWGCMVPMLAYDDAAEALAFTSKDFLSVRAATALFWLIGHVQIRGVLPFVTLLFDEEVDSKGQPWTDLQDVSVSPGETPLDLLQRFSDALGWEFRMLEGFRLFIAQSTTGSHRENEVKFFVGGDQKSHNYKATSREIANHIYSPAADGSMATAIGTSDATPHIREAWAEAGNEPTASSAAAVAQATLEMYQNRQVGRTVQVVSRKGRVPFDDYAVNDWVAIEDENFNTEIVQISSLTVSVDSNSESTYELTVMTRFETIAVRLKRLLDKMGASGLGSTSSSPVSAGSEAQATVKFALLQDVHVTSATAGDVLTFSPTGGVFPVTLNLNYLSDVDTGTVAPVSGQVLKWDGTKWAPGTGTAGPITLSTQGDVVVTGLANGQVLAWNSTTGKWTPLTISAGVTNLDGLTDVTITGLGVGKVLAWNGSQWVPTTPATVPTSLAALTTDVDTAGVVSGKVLAYNGTKWVPTTPSSGGAATLNDLTDVDTAGVVSGKVLGYNGTGWVPVSQTGGGGGSLPAGGVVGDLLRKNNSIDADASWTSGGVFYENGYTVGKTYLPGQIMLRNGILWLCITANMTDPLNSGSASTTTGVDSTAFTRNNCASVDTTNHIVTMINSTAGTTASVISNETFTFATPLKMKWRGSTTTAADALAIGIVSSAQSATVATAVEALPSFYGVVWDVWNNLLKCYAAGTVLASTMALTSDINDDVWEIRYEAAAISLYSSAGALIKSWAITNYSAMGSTFRPAAGARTGGSSGVFKIYGSPIMPGTASDWVSVGKAAVGAPAASVVPAAVGDLVTYSLAGAPYSAVVVSSAASTVIDGAAVNQVSNAFDGNPSTYWHSANGSPQWISAGFASPETVVAVAITTWTFSTARTPRDFNIQGSTDNLNWVTVKAYTGITWPSVNMTQTFEFSNVTAYKYWRIYISASNGDNYQTIAAIVFTAASGAAAVQPVGAAGTVLTADPTVATGLKWSAPSGGGASTLDALTDVATTGAVTGQVLGFDGTQWKPVAGGGASSGGAGGYEMPRLNPVTEMATGLYSWHRADLGVTVDTSTPDPRVTTWADQSGNARDFTGAAGVGPFYRDQIVGGKSFKGLLSIGSERMTSAIVPASGAGARTIIVVLGYVGRVGAAYEHLLHYGNQATNQAYGLVSVENSQFRFGNHYWSTQYNKGPMSASPSPVVVTMQYDGTVDRIWVNGEGGVANTIALNTGTGEGMNLFSRIANLEKGAGSILELITWSRALTASELATVTSRLQVSYGIVSSAGTPNVATRNADLLPLVPSAFDEEFVTDPTGWTDFGTLDSFNTTDLPGQGLHIRKAATVAWNLHGKLKPTPATFPYFMWWKVPDMRFDANYQTVTVCLAAAGAAGPFMVFGGIYGNGNTNYGYGIWNTRTSRSGWGGDIGYPRRNQYYGVMVNSATSIDTYTSEQGMIWKTVQTGINPGFTPAQFGPVVCGQDASVNADGVIKFIRFRSSATPPAEWSTTSATPPSITPWTAGTYAAGTMVTKDEFLWIAYAATSAIPSVGVYGWSNLGDAMSDPATWIPSSLGASLAWWMDASDASTITASAGVVSVWSDKSTYARNATPTGTGPSTGVATVNSKNAVRFVSPQYMTAPLAVANAPFIVAVTFKRANITDTTKGILSFAGSIGDATPLTLFQSQEANVSWFLNSAYRITYACSATVAHTHVLHYDGAVATAYMDGVSMGSYATTSLSGNNAATYLNTGYSGQSNNDIAEVVMITSPTIARRNSVMGYLKNKWGTP